MARAALPRPEDMEPEDREEHDRLRAIIRGSRRRSEERRAAIRALDDLRRRLIRSEDR